MCRGIYMKNCTVGVLLTKLYLHHSMDKYKFMYMYLYECYLLNEKWINEINLSHRMNVYIMYELASLLTYVYTSNGYENLYQYYLIKVIIRGVLGKIIIKSSKYSSLLTIGCSRYAPTVKVSSEGYSSERFSSEPGDVNLKQPIYI